MGIRTNTMGSGYITESYYRDYTRKRGDAGTPVDGKDALMLGADKTAEDAEKGTGTSPHQTDASKEAEGTQEPKSYREQLLEKMEEMAKNIKNGTIQPKFQIGAQEYTIKEWEKLLEKFDAAEDALREEVEASIEEIKKQAEEEAAKRAAMFGMPEPAKMTETSETVEKTSEKASGTKEVTIVSEIAAKKTDVEESDDTDAAALLTDEVTKCAVPTDDPKEKHWYITCYGQEGISCKEAYFDGTRWVNKDLWSLSYTEEGQYEKVMAFLQRFPKDANLQFAAKEDFWKDFLAGEIDEEDFVSLFEN